MDTGLVKAGEQGIEVLLKLLGTDITLRAKDAVRVSGGGFDYSGGNSRAPQRFAIRRVGNGTPTTAEESRKILADPYVMTGRADAVVEPGDTFSSGGISYTVDRVDRTSEYKMVCEITGRKPEPEYDGN